MDNSPDEIFGKENNFIKEQTSSSPPAKPEGNKGVLHNHTIYSIYDGAQTPLELVQAAKKTGYKSVALSDHGSLMALAPFLKACKDEDMNGVVGVELYVTDPKYPEINRGHFCIYAKDDIGLKSVINVLAQSFNYYEKSGMTTKKVFPITSLSILKDFIQKGHVFATTACVTGVLAQTLCGNRKVLKEYDKYTKQLEEIDIESVLRDLEDISSLEKEIESIKATIDTLKNVSTTPLKERIKTLSDKEAINRIKDEIKEIQAANKLKQAKKKELKELLPPLKKELKTYEKSALAKEEKKYNEILEKRNSLPFYDEDTRIERSKKLLSSLISIFGKNNFFIELQYHGLDMEKEYYPKALELAKELSIKTVLANDAHFDVKGKEFKRWLLSTSGSITYYNMVNEPDETETEYYIKTEEEIISKLSEILPQEELQKALNNTYNILNNCSAQIDSSLHFPQFSQTAEEDLKKLATEGAVKRYGTLTDEVKTRLDYELGIINSMGFANYILIVWDYCNYAGDLMEQKFGARVVSNGRGSGAGSVVLYSLGITGIDPLKYGLLFERFLNPNRVSMPDVDADFANCIRQEIFKYVENKYGKDHVSRISTITISQTKGALRTACSIVEHLLQSGKEFPNIDLSRLENYKRPLLRLGDSLSKAYDEALEEVNAELEKKKKALKPTELTQKSLASSYSKFGKGLTDLVISYAAEIEGYPTALGIHAAGCIISDKPVTEYAPVRVSEDKETKEPLSAIEADMIQAEGDFGLIKMDFLGLTTLDVLAETIRQIRNNTGTEIVLENIPLDDKNVYSEIFAKANTAGIFQFESNGMKDVLKRFKPDKFEDIVLINALFRPGPLQFIDSIIQVKEGKTKPHYITNNIKPILDVTYGYPVYQEQLMQIFNISAGFSLGESDILRRLMSKKKAEEFAKYKDKFINGLQTSGASLQEAEDFWEQLLNFAEYA